MSTNAELILIECGKVVSPDTDIANACLFCASDVSRQITGADIPVDGGWAAL